MRILKVPPVFLCDLGVFFLFFERVTKIWRQGGAQLLTKSNKLIHLGISLFFLVLFYNWIKILELLPVFFLRYPDCNENRNLVSTNAC